MDKKLNLREKEAIMRWKLGLGNFNKLLEGKSPIPDKTKKAEKTDWLKPMPDKDVSTMTIALQVEEADMKRLMQGHIPEVQEDHWFMYCDEEYIRYYRSWTGMCAFEGHFHKNDVGMYIIDKVTINHALTEFGINSDFAAVHLFLYLLVAELDYNGEAAWDDFIKAWEKSKGINNKKDKED